MAISNNLNEAILKELNKSPATLSRRATRLARDHGPMSPDEARWVIAHEAGIDLRKHSLSRAQLDRVRQLRSSQATQTVSSGRRPTASHTPSPAPARDTTPTPAAMFNLRNFHPIVVRRSRGLFVGGHNKDAVRATFQSVNNRVKRLSGITGRDGQALMGEAFRSANPALQMTGLTNQSETDEHDGTRLLMMGAMTGLRNPRAHEDKWQPDNDVAAVLDALSFASLLHRFLDRCEVHRDSRAKP